MTQYTTKTDQLTGVREYVSADTARANSIVLSDLPLGSRYNEIGVEFLLASGPPASPSGGSIDLQVRYGANPQTLEDPTGTTIDCTAPNLITLTGSISELVLTPDTSTAGYAGWRVRVRQFPA